MQLKKFLRRKVYLPADTSEHNLALMSSVSCAGVMGALLLKPPHLRLSAANTLFQTRTATKLCGWASTSSAATGSQTQDPQVSPAMATFHSLSVGTKTRLLTHFIPCQHPLTQGAFAMPLVAVISRIGSTSSTAAAALRGLTCTHLVSLTAGVGSSVRCVSNTLPAMRHKYNR